MNAFRLNIGEVPNLQQAIEQAYAEGARNFCLEGTYRAQEAGDTILRLGPALKDVYLDGKDAVLDGRHITSHIVVVEDARVALRGLTLRGGDTRSAQRVGKHYAGKRRRSIYEAIDGAGVLVLGYSQVTLNRCCVEDNYSGMCGGGLSNQSSQTVQVIDSTFKRNTAYHTGGAIDNLTYGARLIARRCKFVDNVSNLGSPVDGPHGQITLFSRTNAEITDCVFLGECPPIDKAPNASLEQRANKWNGCPVESASPTGGGSVREVVQHKGRLAMYVLASLPHLLYPAVRGE